MKIFISYRREDSQSVVQPLCDRLEQAFGPDSVFLDERAIALGSDFAGAVGGAIYTSDVILVVIGPDWATARDRRGRVRLSDGDDPVRLEVGLALASGRLTMPVLVNGAAMPSRRELPRLLRDLVTRSGFRLEDGPGFDASVDQLIQRLGGPVAAPAGPSPSGLRPRRTASLSTFEGRWQTQDGGMTSITQEGDLVMLQGQGANGVVFEGRGQVDGRRTVLDIVNSVGLTGRLSLELTDNGYYANGNLQSHMGVMPLVLMRRA